MKKSNSELSFEEAMEKLEDAVMHLEGSTLSLDDSIAEFENAVKLIKLCEKHLSVAKQKVRMLTETEDGTVTDIPFTGVDTDET